MPDTFSGSIRNFADVLRVNDEGVRTSLNEITNDELAGALHGAPVGVVDKFFRRLSTRAAMMILEHARSEEISSLSGEARKELRQGILDKIRRLVNEGKAVMENPDGPIYPDVSPALARFDTILGWDKATLRARAGKYFAEPLLWEQALHGLPESTVAPFLAKFPWLVRRRIRGFIMSQKEPACPDDVMLIRMELGRTL